MPALEGRDIIARAKTGTGKTLAFGIPIIKKLSEDEEERGFRRYLCAMKFITFVTFIFGRNNSFLLFILKAVWTASPGFGSCTY